MKLYVFDDAVADGWHPFALSRPCSELLFGSLTLRSRLERYAGVRAAGLLTRPWLAHYRESDAPPAQDASDISEADDRLLLSSRLVPDAAARFEPGDAPFSLATEGETVGVYLPRGAEMPDSAWLSSPSPLGSEQPLAGRALRQVWEIVSDSPEQTAADLRARAGSGARDDTAERIGDEPLLLGEGVRIEPGVVFDLRDAPVCLEDGVQVLSGARIAGPFYAGANSRLLGGSMSAVTAGPFSYLRGEVEKTVVLGYTNKAHDGFLGHACVGRWVNLGALTTNSDLKNNYGPVRMAGPEGPVDTGLTKLGCLIGDHAKTAIGTMISTGSALGCGANVFGGPVAGWIPPFSWGREGDVYRKEAFLATAEVAMGRRDVPFDEPERRWLADVWEASGA